MSWSLDDSGKHDGWAATLLADGRELGGGGQDDARTAIGWRASCACGWRSTRLHTRDDHPSVDGWLDVDSMAELLIINEWESHVRPLLTLSAVTDAERNRALAARALDDAVLNARRHGQSWEAIGRAAGISRQSAHERWSGMAE